MENYCQCNQFDSDQRWQPSFIRSSIQNSRTDDGLGTREYLGYHGGNDLVFDQVHMIRLWRDSAKIIGVFEDECGLSGQRFYKWWITDQSTPSFMDSSIDSTHHHILRK